jgi:hypothetical protein
VEAVTAGVSDLCWAVRLMPSGRPRVALIDGETPDLYTSLPSQELLDGSSGADHPGAGRIRDRLLVDSLDRVAASEAVCGARTY